jgi:hypothetical protein
MKFCISAIAALLLLHQQQPSVAFLVPQQHARQYHHAAATLNMAEPAAGTDVSVPYDAAARLAYDEWRSQFQKGDFEAKRFEIFKKNYETVTVANVIAKKKARDTGTVSLALLTLNEFGDVSEKEYLQGMQSLPPPTTSTAVPTTTGDVLSQAVEAAMLQSEASSALGEAADALAEEEEVRTTKSYHLVFGMEIKKTGRLTMMLFLCHTWNRNLQKCLVSRV